MAALAAARIRLAARGWAALGILARERV